MKPLGSVSSAKWQCCVLILAAAIIALAARIPRIGQRPMHGDEAVHADKFRSLLEEGFYRYEPNDYHGPTLNYLTLVPARVSGAARLTQVTEFTLRIVPVFFGVLLVLLLLFMFDGLGSTAAVCAAVLTAISPAMVFYSRYYIQEMLLVCFTFGAIACGYRYTQNKNVAWAVLTGVFAGLMHATKETCIIAFGTMITALFLARISLKKSNRPEDKPGMPKASHLFVFIGTAVLVSLLLYSSFFQNPKGILDSVLAFGPYFSRAGNAGFHSHPLYFYLKMLAFSQYGNGPVWSEALILVLALVGGFAAFKPFSGERTSPFLLRVVASYTILATAAYSLIPYKTPWNMLPFYIGFILLAGYGAAFLLRISKKLIFRTAVILALGLGILHLGMQSYSANFEFYADSRNPYVYAHTSADFMNLVKRINDLAPHHPDQEQILIKVITQPDEAWPLPWYLRSFKRVGYWQEMEEAGALGDVPLIVSSGDKISQLQPYLEDNHILEYYELRPGVLLALYIEKNLWDVFLQKQTVK